MRKRPNIILITVDELKADVLGCMGNSHAHTPAMDQFAVTGACFTNAFTVCPKCVPARAALMTGRYPHTDGHRTLPGLELSASEPSLLKLLRTEGYRVALFGKNHTILESQIEDAVDACHSGAGVGRLPKTRVLDPENEAIFRSFYRGEVEDRRAANDWGATEQALNFLAEAGRESFFVNLNLKAPHAPYFAYHPYIDAIRRNPPRLPEVDESQNSSWVVQRLREVYALEDLRPQDWQNILNAYYSMAALSDECIGRILQGLEDMGLADSTIVVITADHGDFAGEHGCVEKWDTLFFDSLVKIPLLVRDPSVEAVGHRSEALLEIIDIAPTILDLCGLPQPNWMHGRSVADIVRGGSRDHRSEVFAEGGVEAHTLPRAVPADGSGGRIYPGYATKQEVLRRYPQTLMRSKMVRTERWKLVYRENGEKEFYDLHADPGELRLLEASKVPDEVQLDLVERLLRWEIRSETDYPEIPSLYA